MVLSQSEVFPWSLPNSLSVHKQHVLEIQFDTPGWWCSSCFEYICVHMYIYIDQYIYNVYKHNIYIYSLYIIYVIYIYYPHVPAQNWDEPSMERLTVRFVRAKVTGFWEALRVQRRRDRFGIILSEPRNRWRSAAKISGYNDTMNMWFIHNDYGLFIHDFLVYPHK